MKWVKFTDDFNDKSSLYKFSEGYDAPSFKYETWEKTEIKKVCFKEIRCNRIKFENALLHKDAFTDLEKNFADEYHKWVCHNGLPEAYFDPKYFETDYFTNLKVDGAKPIPYRNVTPHPYEIFIGGWLHFYDSEVQCGNSNYAVYFHWDYKCKCVTVYISQLDPASRLNVNVNINIANPPAGSQDPPPPKIPPPYC